MSDSDPVHPGHSSGRPPTPPTPEPPYAPLPAYDPPSAAGPWRRVPVAPPEKDRTALVVAVCITVVMLLVVLAALAVAYFMRSDTVTATGPVAVRPDATKGPAGG